MMALRPHTVGPWIYGEGTNERSWPAGWIMAPNAPKGPMHVADVRGWGHLTGHGHGALGLSYDEAFAIQMANARLIAAAPNMLSALKGVHEYETQRGALGSLSSAWERVIEAINEAT